MLAAGEPVKPEVFMNPTGKLVTAVIDMQALASMKAAGEPVSPEVSKNPAGKLVTWCIFSKAYWNIADVGVPVIVWSGFSVIAVTDVLPLNVSRYALAAVAAYSNTPLNSQVYPAPAKEDLNMYWYVPAAFLQSPLILR